MPIKTRNDTELATATRMRPSCRPENMIQEPSRGCACGCRMLKKHTVYPFHAKGTTIHPICNTYLDRRAVDSLIIVVVAGERFKERFIV